MHDELQHWNTLLDHLERDPPKTAEELQLKTQQLGAWHKPIWIAAGLGALQTHVMWRPITHPEITLATVLAEAWLACPCPQHSQAAADAQFTPRGLWTNCNDRLHVSRIAASKLVAAIGTAGALEQIVRAAVIMAHPLVFEPHEVWDSMAQRIRQHIDTQLQQS